jgi:two-component sensor histidine kinase
MRKKPEKVEVNWSLCRKLDQEIQDYLKRVVAGLRVTTDVSRSDILLYCRAHNSLAVFAQAMPNSMAPLFQEFIVGRMVSPKEEPKIWEAVSEGKHGVRQLEILPGTAPVYQEVIPLTYKGKPVPAAAAIYTNLIEHERQRHRSPVFQKAVKCLQRMCWAGALHTCGELSPFTEWDGIVYVNDKLIIKYMSGVAMNQYRRIGLLGELLGHRLTETGTEDAVLVKKAFSSGACIEEEGEESGRLWVRKVIPMICPEMLSFLKKVDSKRYVKAYNGAMILIHDATDEKLKEREIRVKNAMIQEIHHRVKNNLQTVASLLRMQQRRAKTEETKDALQEAISRILSISAIHEYLSHSSGQTINIRDVLKRIVNQTQELLSGELPLRIYFKGADVYLPPQHTTACALIVNELLQNAIEHGHTEVPKPGEIMVELNDLGDEVKIEVKDNGVGLPPDFDPEKVSSLGLQIVNSLTKNELRGSFQLRREGDYTIAEIRFPKAISKESSNG